MVGQGRLADNSFPVRRGFASHRTRPSVMEGNTDIGHPFRELDVEPLRYPAAMPEASTEPTPAPPPASDPAEVPMCRRQWSSGRCRGPGTGAWNGLVASRSRGRSTTRPASPWTRRWYTFADGCSNARAVAGGVYPAEERADGSSGRAWRCDDRSARHRGGVAGVGLAIRVETYACGVGRCGYILRLWVRKGCRVPGRTGKRRWEYGMVHGSDGGARHPA